MSINTIMNITNQTQCHTNLLQHFSKNIFTKEKLLDGAILIHIITLVYLTGLLIFVTQSYLMGCLRRIAHSFDITDEIAVTTLYSTGMSTPILFASIIINFLLKHNVNSDIFLISGSCAINILGSSLCSVSVYSFSQRYFIVKDKLTFLIFSTILIWILNNGGVRLNDGLTLKGLYLIFDIVSCLSKKIAQSLELFSKDKCTKHETENETIPIVQKHISIPTSGLEDSESPPTVYRQASIPERDEHQAAPIFNEHTRPSISEVFGNETNSASFYKYGQVPIAVVDKNEASPIFCKKARVSISDVNEIRYFNENDRCDERQMKLYDNTRVNTNYRHPRFSSTDTDYDGYTTDAWYTSHEETIHKTGHTFLKLKGPFFFTADIKEYKHGPKSPFTAPKSIMLRIAWYFLIPAVCVLYSNIPDCRNPHWKNWWFMTFSMCQLWICILSYLIIWLSYIIANTFEIHENILVLTLLAMTLSSPSLVTSVLLNKRGHGGLGITNSIGCGIFHISISLGLPLFVKCVLQQEINTKSEHYVNILIGVIIFTCAVFALKFFIQNPNRWVTVTCLLFYVIFVIIELLMLLNIIKGYGIPHCKLNT